MPKPCPNLRGGVPIGVACPDCGHTNIVHTLPSLGPVEGAVCMICKMRDEVVDEVIAEIARRKRLVR